MSSTAVAPVEDVTDDIDPRLVNNPWLIRLFTHTTFMVFLVDVALVVLFTLLSDNNVFWSTGELRSVGTQRNTDLVAVGWPHVVVGIRCDRSLRRRAASYSPRQSQPK